MRRGVFFFYFSKNSKLLQLYLLVTIYKKNSNTTRFTILGVMELWFYFDMFSHVNLDMGKDWNTADATFLNMMMAMKQIVHETSLPPKFWPETLDAVTLLMNHLPNARNMSKDEKTKRPIEILSAGIVSKRYCNHVLFYFCSPGTPSYCSAPCETGEAMSDSKISTYKHMMDVLLYHEGYQGVRYRY
jgi:hypothetical protein